MTTTEPKTEQVHGLRGRVFIRGDIKLLSGLHVGGKQGAVSIGGVDSPVIRNPADGKPYIPGSSLKGKMRSLCEKLSNAPQNRSIGKDVRIHVAGGDKASYKNDEAAFKAACKADYENLQYGYINKIFGVPSEIPFEIPAPNRLIVRDVVLSQDSIKDLDNARTDLPYTEIKWEAVIDRVTSAATPRQIERVPAGAVFSPMELVFSVYLNDDIEQLFKHVIIALQLVEDDYLGGHGSRGSGKVAFENLSLQVKAGASYTASEAKSRDSLATAASAETLAWLRDKMGLV